MTSRTRFLTVAVLSLVVGTGHAAPEVNRDVQIYDRILANLEPGQEHVAISDMMIPVATVQRWRARLAGTVSPSAGTRPDVTLWTGGQVFYAFHANVSTIRRQRFRDAAAEWAMFANLTFTERTSQPNYIQVTNVIGLSGGNSFVGMIGGAQALNMGDTAWNRSTLVHEIGHALGLQHEHQRSDRNTFVDILEENIIPGTEGNFVLIPNTVTYGPYDFASTMHYDRNLFSIAPATKDTIQLLPAFAQFAFALDGVDDRPLSRGDRVGIASMYGAGPVLGAVVTNTNDTGLGSLRAAIYHTLDLALNDSGANPVISFNIPTTDPGFNGTTFTIIPTGRLPSPGPRVTLDGTTQPGNTNPNGPEIVLNGALCQPPDSFSQALRLVETGTVVRGLVVNGFSEAGIILSRATGCAIEGCYVGTNASGTAPVPNALAGIEVAAGSTGNRIGGTTAAARNVISGNSQMGVGILGVGASGNRVEGNFIGVNPSGTSAVPNTFAGVTLFDGSSGNVIGGTAAGVGNVISGNANEGVRIEGVHNNVVAGNFIGTNASGTVAIPNQFSGVALFNAAQGNMIGGTVVGARNVISGNTNQGVAIIGTGTTGNTVAGNFIGTDSTGTGPLGNGTPGFQFAGITIFDGASHNVIGPGNVLSGNTAQGVFIVDPGSDNNTVIGNIVGLNSSGTAALPNQFSGVAVASGAKNNIIGGATPGTRNILSGNANQGVLMSGSGTTGNRVSGNYVGINAAGTVAIGNGFPGIEIFGAASGNVIGGASPGEGNVISGNAFRGLSIVDVGTTANVIAGNLIGLNAAGTAALGNDGAGIAIFSGAQSNVIGGTSGGRNFISGNLGPGIDISGTGTDLMLVQGNTIGLGPSGVVIGNSGSSGVGVRLFGGAQRTVIGGSAPGAPNVIAANAQGGVEIYDAATTQNTISGNSFFGNGRLAINLEGGTQNGARVTTNDTGDGDTGPNGLQNYPVLTSATLGLGTTIVGSINTTANSTVRIEFFASGTADPSGFGEALDFIGALDLATNGSGNATINQTFAFGVPAGYFISATATAANGNTSEFSQNRVVTTTDTDADGLPNVYETANGLSTALADALIDSDGDGMSNLAEFRAGTDPRNPSSVLRLPPVTRASGNVQLMLPTLPGLTYRLEYADDLSVTSPWRMLADQLSGTGSTLPLVDPGAATLPQRFYRARALPQ